MIVFLILGGLVPRTCILVRGRLAVWFRPMDLFRFGGVLEVQYVLRSLERQSQGEGIFEAGSK